MTGLPLKGIRVLQFGQNGSAPLTGVHLADFGAEVIKVESSAKMDRIRFLVTGKPGLPFEDMVDSSIFFNEWNRGAISALANTKKPEAIDLMKKLAKISDVVVENFSPRYMKSVGLGYEDLVKANPKIIYISLSAAGQEGPYHEMVTFGATISSVCGKQSLMGYPDGEPFMDFGLADYQAGNQAAFLVMCALRHRNKTGEGQYIDMGQVAPVVYTLGEPMMDFVMNKRVAKMQGNWRTGFCPHNTYRCRPNPLQEQIPIDDQWVAISVETEEEWQSLCNVMGNPAWTKDEKFSARDKRWRNQEELDELITQWTIKFDKDEVQAVLQAADVAAIGVTPLTEKEFSPQCKARNMYVMKDWRAIKGVPMKAPGVVIHGIETTGGIGPELGKANDYVYGDLLGLSKDEIERLKKDQVIM